VAGRRGGGPAGPAGSGGRPAQSAGLSRRSSGSVCSGQGR
jgi:hypothetical protein